jgi:hypothetical protein
LTSKAYWLFRLACSIAVLTLAPLAPARADFFDDPRRADPSGEARLDDGEQRVRVERLRDGVHGPESPRDLEEIGVADVPAAGHGDDLRVGLGCAQVGDRAAPKSKDDARCLIRGMRVTFTNA